MNKRWSLAIAIILTVVLVASRLYDLEADPPGFFADGSQGLTTDAGHLTLAAKNKVAFGDWDYLGYKSWLAFKASVVSAACYVTFSIAGVSRSSANLAAAALQLLSIVIFVVALRRVVDTRSWLYTLVFIATSFVLVVYSRLPFSENGLLLLSSLVFLVHTFWHRALWGKIALGILVFACAAFGKSFGVVMIMPPLATIWLCENQQRWRSTIALLTAAMLPLVLYEIAFSSEGGLVELLAAYTTEGHGLPEGLSSPLKFVEHLVAFAAKSGLFAYNPVIALLTYVFLYQTIRSPGDTARLNPSTVFLVVWLLSRTIVISPFNYLPLRYFCAMILPMSALAGLVLTRWSKTDAPPSRARIFGWRAIALGLLNWIAAYYVIVRVFVSLESIDQFRDFVWYALPAGLGITAVQFVWHRRATEKNRSTSGSNSRQVGWRQGLVWLSLAITVALFLYQGSQWLAKRTYGIAETNYDLCRLLNDGAVLSGPYGPALTADCSVAAIPYYTDDVLSADDNARELARVCNEYPITHLALGKAHWRDLAQRFPSLADAPFVGSYWVRDNIIYIVRVSELFRNERAVTYVPSDYENGMALIQSGQKELGKIQLNSVVRDHPTTKAPHLELYYLSIADNDIEEAKAHVDALLELFPTDFAINMLGALYYKYVGTAMRDQTHLDRAQFLLDRAVYYNPANEASLTRAFESAGPAARIL